MSDTLEIFGQEWTGVTGFKATDDNDTIKTFIRPQGTISISQNGQGIDVSQYQYADVSVSGGSTPDGNDYYYGTNPEITPYVGYGEVDSAVLR